MTDTVSAPRETSIPPRRKTLDALTGLRIYAAALVVMFHYMRERVSNLPIVAPIAASGFVGVGLFFVLSGFVLAYTYESAGRELDRRAFWWARFARVYPVYALALIAAFPFFVHRVELGQAVTLAPFVLTLTQAWIPGAACKWNCPGWTLSAEAFFYLLFPLLLPLLVALSRRRQWALALGGWLVAVAACALVAGLAAPTTRLYQLTEYCPLLRLPEFMLGIVGCLWYLDGGRLPIRSRIPVVGVLIALIVAPRLPYLVVHNGLFAPLFALLVLSIASGASKIERHLSSRPVVGAGKASYAVYLLHVPLYDFLRQVSRYRGVALDSSWIAFSGYIVILAVSAAVVLNYFEEPVRRWIRAIDEERRAHHAAQPPLSAVQATGAPLE